MANCAYLAKEFEKNLEIFLCFFPSAKTHFSASRLSVLYNGKKIEKKVSHVHKYILHLHEREIGKT
jgi:hypothetical protein